MASRRAILGALPAIGAIVIFVGVLVPWDVIPGVASSNGFDANGSLSMFLSRWYQAQGWTDGVAVVTLALAVLVPALLGLRRGTYGGPKLLLAEFASSAVVTLVGFEEWIHFSASVSLSFGEEHIGPGVYLVLGGGLVTACSTLWLLALARQPSTRSSSLASI